MTLSCQLAGFSGKGVNFSWEMFGGMSPGEFFGAKCPRVLENVSGEGIFHGKVRRMFEEHCPGWVYKYLRAGLQVSMRRSYDLGYRG